MSSQQHHLPPALVQSLRQLEHFDAAAFEAVHAAGNTLTSIRINPAKKPNTPLWPANNFAGIDLSPVPWSINGYYLSSRPSFTLDPLLHAGAYYVQEASSMFLEQALTQLVSLQEPLVVLDLCAAPGGKSTHIQSLLSSNSVLMSNELIKPRVNILLENITKWGAANCIVTNNEAADFGKLPALFDVIVIDAPCSGSGLFRKDPEAIEEWSEANVQMCGQRQQKILEDVWPALKPGGLLLYSTCSYSVEEDENITDFIIDNFAASNCRLKLVDDWGIVETQSVVHKNYGYRFYPYSAMGEGFFLSCFKKEEETSQPFVLKSNTYKPDKKNVTLASSWVTVSAGYCLYQHQEQLFIMPENCYQLFLNLQKQLHIRKAGIKLGDMARNEIIPDHALALSALYSHTITRIELSKEQALAFLRKDVFEQDFLSKGWMLSTYEGLAIGWLKSLGNRFNNYYPKEWKIRS